MGKAPTQSSDAALVVGRILARYWMPIAAAILFVIAQLPSLKIWWGIWMQDYSYYSHGPLIPFMVAYMVWGNRHRLAAAKMGPHWTGYVLLVASAAVFVLANWTESATLHGLMFIAMIFAAILVFWGGAAARILAVPVLFLITMIPMGATLLDSATGKFQLQSAAIAAQFLRWTGYTADLRGATIYSPGLPEPLIVGIPCSGLRTLISLLTFTVFFIYLVRSAWWKKGVLLALSFPLSVFINSLRITMIGYAGFWTGSAEAMHKFHDYSGYIGLIICFAILFGFAKLMRIGQFGFGSGDPPKTEDPSEPRRTLGWAAPGLVVLFVFSLTALSNVFASPIYPRTKGRIDRADIPKSFGNWQGKDIPIDQLVLTTLAKGDLLNRRYTEVVGRYGREVQLFMTAARDPEAFHDPHVCLPGGGSPISDDRIITIKIDKPRPVTIRATLLETTNDFGQSVVLYFYMTGSESLPRTGDVWTRNRHNLIRDARRLILSPTRTADLREEIERRQFVWYRFSTEVLIDTETDTQFLIGFIRQFAANTKGFGR